MNVLDVYDSVRGLALDSMTKQEHAIALEARAAIAELIEAAKAVNDGAYISEHVANADSGCELCHAFGLIEQALAKVQP